MLLSKKPKVQNVNGHEKLYDTNRISYNPRQGTFTNNPENEIEHGMATLISLFITFVSLIGFPCAATS